MFEELSVSELDEYSGANIESAKKMVFLAAIREESLRRVALPWDAHVMSAKSDGIRQPCTE